jgi:sulfur carrier protein
MMTLNGKPFDPGTASALTLHALLAAAGFDPQGRGIAIAVNGTVAPRRLWADWALQKGDAVEIVTIMQGG